MGDGGDRVGRAGPWNCHARTVWRFSCAHASLTIEIWMPPPPMPISRAWPARSRSRRAARMLCCLMDGHARTATELAAIAEVAASTASAHLARLKEQRLVQCGGAGQASLFPSRGRRGGGRARGPAGGRRRAAHAFARPRPAGCAPRAPATTTWPAAPAVALHDRLHAQGWLRARRRRRLRTHAGGRDGAREPGHRMVARRARVAASPAPASTGASAGPTWAARWGRPGCSCRCAAAGCGRTSTAGRWR